MDDLISIVIPTYNRAERVRRALQSILDQDYKNWEAVVVDDGSADKTVEVVGALAAGDARIRLIRQARRGAQAARNRGIAAARGEWIAFLDSDDHLVPGSLRIRKETAERAGVEFVHSEALIVRDGAPTPTRFGVPPIEGQGWSRLLAGPGPMFQGMLVRKRLLERVGELDERVTGWQEWDLSIRLARVTSMAFVPQPTFVYDCRAQDRVSLDGTSAARGYARIVWKNLLWIVVRVGPRALARHWYTVGTLNAGCGRRARAAWYHAMALGVAVFSPGLLIDRARRQLGAG